MNDVNSEKKEEVVENVDSETQKNDIEKIDLTNDGLKFVLILFVILLVAIILLPFISKIL